MEQKLNVNKNISSHVTLAEVKQDICTSELLKDFETDLKNFWYMPTAKEDIEIAEKKFVNKYCNDMVTN